MESDEQRLEDLEFMVMTQSEVLGLVSINAPIETILDYLRGTFQARFAGSTIEIALNDERSGSVLTTAPSAWSMPIISSTGNVSDHPMGTVTASFPHTVDQTEGDRWLLDQLARLVQLVLERYQAQQHVSELLADERRRLAEELHDDPIQAITTVGLRLQRLARTASDEQQEQLADIQRAVGGAVERMRRMLFELHPPSLDDEGLGSAVELYLYERLDPLDIGWTLRDDLTTVPSTASASLAYRLIREALTNVARHAEATSVDVTLENDEGGLLCRVIDDGVGFDPAAVTSARAGHLGTVSSRYLAHRASGRWSVTSALGHGTTVEFWLPTGILS